MSRGVSRFPRLARASIILTCLYNCVTELLPSEVLAVLVHSHLGAFELIELAPDGSLVARSQSRPRLVRASIIVVCLVDKMSMSNVYPTSKVVCHALLLKELHSLG